MSKLNRQNHELFRVIYGDFEFERLRHIFETEPEPINLNTNWDIPPIEEVDVKIRLLCLAGIGSIAFLQKLCSDKKIMGQVKSFIFVENDPKVISHLINDPNFAWFINHQTIRLCFDMNQESIKPNLFRILKHPHFSDVMELGCVFWNRTVTNASDRAFYEQMDQSIKETVNHIYTNYGEINDSVQGIRATMLNGDKIFNCPGILDLKDAYAGKPALVIGAGPSLDDAIPELQKHKDKYVILAADAAVKPLIAAGIYPHYCTSIERLNDFQKPFWENLDPGPTELVCFPVLHPEVINLYQGKIRVVYRNYSYYAYFEKNWPKGILACGSSTSNLAVRLAHYMGCSSITLIGIDHAYKKREDGLYKSHADNVGHGLWTEYHPISYFEGEPRKHAPAFEVEGYDGEPTMTNYTYYLWSKEFAEEVLNLSIPIINTAAKGVKMANIPYEPLESVNARHPDIKVVKKEPSNPVYHKSWEHGTLVQSVRGWMKLCKEVLAILDNPIDLNMLRYVSDIYNIKFIREDIFVSFIIQNCAGDYYRLQNAYNGLEMGEGLDIEKHSKLMKQRFELFLRVLEKVDVILKETLTNGN